MASILPKQAAVSPTAASPALQSPQSSPGADKKVAHTHLQFTLFPFLGDKLVAHLVANIEANPCKDLEMHNKLYCMGFSVLETCTEKWDSYPILLMFMLTCLLCL